MMRQPILYIVCFQPYFCMLLCFLFHLMCQCFYPNSGKITDNDSCKVHKQVINIKATTDDELNDFNSCRNDSSDFNNVSSS